jgi:hypothetical protein
MAGDNAGLSALDSLPDGRPGQRPADHRAAITRTASHTVVVVLRKWNAVDGNRLAAAISFYSMLSLAPFLLLVVAVGNWWLGTDTAMQYLSSRIEDLIRADAARLVEPLARSHDMLPSTHRFGAQVGTLVTIIGATAACAELVPLRERNRPHKKSGRMQASAQRSPGEGAPSG